MKRKIDSLDATPPKEIYRSIIVDYNVNLGICELVDNAIDIWTKDHVRKNLAIDINLDSLQQAIIVTDNSGGIHKDDLLLFISPGRTSNTATEDTIGIFGVGAKRAVVALAEKIKMRTRKGKEATYQIEFDEDWLADESWNMDIFEVDQINPSTTIIELHGLRLSIDDSVIERLRSHLSSTYALFLKKGNLEIKLNRKQVRGIEFDSNWAYPPNYYPHRYLFSLPIDGKRIKIDIVGGVIGEDATRGGESGVYFYCNDRLIVKSLKDHEVGYYSGMAGLPNHPGAALGRVIVKLNGEAQFMPWNSSKSAINYQNKVFESVREKISEIVGYFVGLSRRTQGDWPNQVYKFKEGEIVEREIAELNEINPYSIPLPRTRKRYDEKITERNRAIAKKKPWVVGLYEAIGAVDLIVKKSFKQRNRFALVMLDSNLEIALKEYLVNEVIIGLDKFRNIINNRSNVIAEVKKSITSIKDEEWQKINYYYNMRNNLIHQKATAEVSDDDIDKYRKLVEKVLKALFGLKF